MKKFNLIIPLCGKGSRFLAAGVEIPKPMLVCGDKTILEWSMQSIYTSECNIIFIVRKDHIQNFSIDSFLRNKWPDCIIVASDGDTSGACETVLLADKYVSLNLPLIVYTPDTTFLPKYSPNEAALHKTGFILTFKANSPNYSYSVVDNGSVKRVAEKDVISDAASVGVYGFPSWQCFKSAAKEYIIVSKAAGKECHIAPLYNYLIRDEISVEALGVNSIHVMGTPEEFKFCEEVSFKYFRPRKFALCSDHSGFTLKEKIKGIFDSNNTKYIDFGCYAKRDCDYNPYVKAVCDYIKKEKDFFGIGCCRTGQGVNICANKQSGIRACLITDQYSASMAIKHNAANFFSLPENNNYSIEGILDYLTNEVFDGGRHQNRMIRHEAF